MKKSLAILKTLICSAVSEKPFNHHIKNEKQGKIYDNTFKTNIENKQNKPPGPDHITSELILN